MVTKVAIDAGHGKDGDPGAVGPSGLQEADVTLRLADFLERELKPSGMTVFRPDRDLVSSQRARQATDQGCGLLVSLHCNAADPQAKGIEVWYAHQNEPGQRLAEALMESLNALGLSLPRGIKDDGDWRPAVDPNWKGGMGVLRSFDGPAALVELLFLSNPAEEMLLADDRVLQSAAAALCQGIRQWIDPQALDPPVFSDVPAQLWDGQATRILRALLDRGIFVGYPDGTFRPDQPITRLECAAALCRLLTVKGEAPWKTS
jgi:N-acetylmuramoyl-L-alanine amidase